MWVISTQLFLEVGILLVKCRICGNKIERKEAYKVVSDSRNNYYCNETEYMGWLLKRESKDNTYNIIYEIFERKVTNTALYKEINGLAEVYTYEKIYAYLKENKAYLDNVMKKDFSSEYAQIRYFAAILKNSLADFKYKSKTIEKIKRICIDMPDYKFNRKKPKKTLTEYEEEAGDGPLGTL